jgi:hypothetical protein
MVIRNLYRLRILTNAGTRHYVQLAGIFRYQQIILSVPAVCLKVAKRSNLLAAVTALVAYEQGVFAIARFTPESLIAARGLQISGRALLVVLIKIIRYVGSSAEFAVAVSVVNQRRTAV